MAAVKAHVSCSSHCRVSQKSMDKDREEHQPCNPPLCSILEHSPLCYSTMVVSVELMQGKPPQEDTHCGWWMRKQDLFLNVKLDEILNYRMFRWKGVSEVSVLIADSLFVISTVIHELIVEILFFAGYSWLCCFHAAYLFAIFVRQSLLAILDVI